MQDKLNLDECSEGVESGRVSCHSIDDIRVVAPPRGLLLSTPFKEKLLPNELDVHGLKIAAS